MSDDRRSADHDEVARALRDAGPRTPPDFDLESVRDPVEEAWQRAVARRQAGQPVQKPSLRLLPLAAVLAVAVAGVLLSTLWMQDDSSVDPTSTEFSRPDDFAVVEAIVRASDADADADADLWGLELAVPGGPGPAWLPAAEADGRSLVAGSVLGTPSTRVALRLAGGHEVRLDQGTVLLLESEAVLELRSGAVYVDAAVPDLAIRTPRGTVRHVGTRYEVRLDPPPAEAVDQDADQGVLHVRVRSGTVAWTAPTAAASTDAAPLGAAELRAGAGQALRVDDTSAELVSYPVAGAGWSWIHDAASFDTDGATLVATLQWIADEMGWRLDVLTESQPAEPGGSAPERIVVRQDDLLLDDGTPVVLRGSLDPRRPDALLEQVAAVTDLELRRDGRTIVLEAAGASTDQ